MSSIKSEDEIGRKYDKFVSNSIIKMGIIFVIKVF
jgi:hypothetical protein